MAFLVAVLALTLAQPGAASLTSPVEQARALVGAGRTDEAIAALRAAAAAAPADAAVHNMLGALLNREGRYQEALPHAARAAELRPDEPRYRYNRGIVLAEHGRFADALADFDFAITRMPGQAPMHLERGAALLSLGRDQDARADWAAARRIDPSLSWTDWYDGLHDLIDGRADLALPKLRAVAAAHPEFATARPWLVLAGDEAEAGEVSDAWVRGLLDFHSGRRSFEEILAIAGNDGSSGDQRRVGEAWLHRGIRARVAGRTDEAILALRRAEAIPAPRHAWKLLVERELRRLTAPR